MITLKNGMSLPSLGQGTWNLGEPSGDVAQEVSTLRRGIEMGLNLLDTAEMYGSGRSEQLISKAMQGISREKLLIVSKVYPQNSGTKSLPQSLDNSLKNLGTDYLDLYLLHWRGNIPLAETIFAMEQAVSSGKIRAWGVSNFDTDDMQELLALPQGENCQVNQVLYHLGSRGVEFQLLPYLQEQKIPLMAYCPLAQAGSLQRGLLENQAVKSLAQQYSCETTTILLAFALQKEQVFAIPKASTVAHVEENARALSLRFTSQELALLDEAFPPPKRKTHLDVV